MSTVESKKTSNELALVRAENNLLQIMITKKDSEIQKLTEKLKGQKLRIRALKLINKKLVKEKKEFQEQLESYLDPVTNCKDYIALTKELRERMGNSFLSQEKAEEIFGCFRDTPFDELNLGCQVCPAGYYPTCLAMARSMRLFLISLIGEKQS